MSFIIIFLVMNERYTKQNYFYGHSTWHWGWSMLFRKIKTNLSKYSTHFLTYKYHSIIVLLHTFRSIYVYRHVLEVCFFFLYPKPNDDLMWFYRVSSSICYGFVSHSVSFVLSCSLFFNHLATEWEPVNQSKMAWLPNPQTLFLIFIGIQVTQKYFGWQKWSDGCLWNHLFSFLV